MEYKVVCSDCGKEFVVIVDEGFDPSACPGCGNTISDVTKSVTSDDYTAITE